MIKMYNGATWQFVENDWLLIAQELYSNPSIEYLEVNFPHAFGYQKFNLEIDEMEFILNDGEEMVAAFSVADMHATVNHLA